MRWLLLGLFALLLTAAARAEEMAERSAIARAMVEAIAKEDFAAIEAMYGEYRRSRARTPGGTFKATRMFYYLHRATLQPGTANPRTPGGDGRDASMQAYEALLWRWQTRFPHSSLAALALTHAYIERAFLHRGTGLASEVTQDGWRGFNHYLGLAEQHLDRKHPALERDEAWFMARLRLAKFTRTDVESFVRLVDEASKRYPYFYDAYFTAASSLEPKWGGSVEGIEWVAQVAVRHTRAEDGESAYARVYWSVAQGGYFDTLFETTLVQWPRMKAGFEDLVARYPDPWNQSNYAFFACLARDGATVRKLFDRLGHQLYAQIWRGNQLARCRALADEAGPR